MNLNILKKFDKNQLFRLFIDGRLQSKYDGWRGYENMESGSTQSMLNAFSFMIDNFELNNALNANYILKLHKIAMFNVKTKNIKSSPGDLRYLNSGMPFFKKSTTLEHIQEVLDLRYNDNTIVFNTPKFKKKAEELNADELFSYLQKENKLNYKPWYPNITQEMQDALDGQHSLSEFYESKNYIQIKFANQIDKIVKEFNDSIKISDNENEKIYIISKIVRNLELLHPFPDGNCRVFANVLLNHLLLYYGIYPSLLNNPNLDGECSYEQFSDEIKLGIKNTKTLLKIPSAKVFNYSIDSASKSDKEKFSNMSKELITKIQNYDSLYLTLDILELITTKKWVNYNKYINLKGIGSHTTVQENFLYYCFTKDWKKDNKDIKKEIFNAAKKGASAFIIDDEKYMGIIDKPMLLVDDCLSTMEQVSAFTRQNVDCKVVLITGTVGKTSFKFQLNHCLKNQTKIHAFLNSVNTKIPILRTLSSLSKDDKVEVVELSVGSSHKDVVNRSKMIAPDICIFTEVDQNHMNIHKNIKNLVAAKSSAIMGLSDRGICIINSDAYLYNEMKKEILRLKKDTNIITFGTKEDDNARLIKSTFDTKEFTWKIKAKIENIVVEYTIPLFHSHAPLQSVGVLLSIKRLGYDVVKAAHDYSKDFESFSSIGRIFKLNFNEKNITFYDQSYRGAIQGMRSAFSDIKNMNLDTRKIFVIGASSTKVDNEFTKSQHVEIAHMLTDIGVDRLYTTGNFMDYVHDNLDNNILLTMHSENLNEIATSLKKELRDDDFLFIMGSGDLYLGRLGEKILNFGKSIRIR